MTDFIVILKTLNSQEKVSLRLLKKYPESLLAILANRALENNPKIAVVDLSFMDYRTLSVILDFYENDVWPNTFLYENKMKFRWNDQIMENFEEICQYLMLPNYSIEDVEQDDWEIDEKEEKEMWRQAREKIDRKSKDEKLERQMFQRECEDWF